MRGLFGKRKENNVEDREIINLYWAREEKAIEATAEKYGHYCHAIAYNILQNNEDAEECVNDTYLGAWNTIPPQRPCPLSAYLGKITRNIAINRYKRYAAQKRGGGQLEIVLSELEGCISVEETVDKALDEKALTAAIERFLYAASDTKRHIFIRRYWHLWSIKSIAEEFHMTEAKVTSILFRMRGELKKQLEKEGISV